MEPEKKKDPLERIENELYSPEEPPKYAPQKLSPKEFGVKNTWNKDRGLHRPNEETFPGKEKTIKKIFLWSVVFFVAASAFAGYRLFLGPMLNPKDVDVRIEAPTNIPGGEEETLRLIVKNNNRSAIEGISIDIAYSDGITITGNEDAKERRFHKNVGALLSGVSHTEEVNFVAFGAEDEVKKMSIKVEYRIQGTSRTFIREKEYSFILSNAPLSLSFETPDEVNADESFTVNVEATSNAPEVLKNVALLISYPPGFSVQSQIPKAGRGNNMWVIGDMNPGDVYKLSLKGKLSGHTEDQKTFTFTLGEADSDGGSSIETIYNQSAKTITIRQSFVGIEFLCDGDKSEEVAISDNKEVNCEINWKNNFPTNVLNGNFRIGITGSVINRGSIQAAEGFYKSDENALYWDQTTDNGLAVISPSDAGSYRFSFKTVPLLAGSGGVFQNPEINFNLVFKGDRIAAGQTSEPITISLSKKVKVSSALTVDSYGLYYTGQFANKGPLPPTVDQKTTYTIVWRLNNSSNDIRNTMVTASLPIYAEWLGAVSPFNENIQFNSTSNTISWNVGSLPAGTGVTRQAREVTFQIGFVPSISQKRTAPLLVSPPQLSGIDSFSNDTVNAAGALITTELTRDPPFNRLDESQVVE